MLHRLPFLPHFILLTTMLARVRDFLEMIRFSHTLFALPFALSGALLAWRAADGFRWLDLVGIFLCMVAARSAAMGFNRLADRRFDAENPRTAQRHLPTGRLSPTAVAWFTILSGVAFVAATAIFIVSRDNWLPLILAVPVLVFIGGYSLTKRFTSWSHFWLGAALMLGPVAAWIAIRGRFAPWLDAPFSAGSMYSDWPPLFLGLAVLTWVAGFDILYACQDVDFDRRSGLYSVPARLGVAWSLLLAKLCHAAMIVLLLVLWKSAELGSIYLFGVAAAALLLAYEHWLVRPDDLTRVNQAFFQVNSIISIGLFAVVALDIYFGG